MIAFSPRAVSNYVVLEFAQSFFHAVGKDVFIEVFESIGLLMTLRKEELLVANKVIGESLKQSPP